MKYYTQWLSTNIVLACSDIISHLLDIGQVLGLWVVCHDARCARCI